MIINDIKKAKIMAMKEKNTDVKNIMNIVINKFMLLDIENKAKEKETTDAEVIKLVQKTIKELTDEAENYRKAGNATEVAIIENQKKALEKYLPKMMDETEIKAVINSLEDKSIPNVMKHFKQNYAGKCDMGLVSKTLRSM